MAKEVGIAPIAQEFNHGEHLRELHRAAKSPPIVRVNPAGGKRRAE